MLLLSQIFGKDRNIIIGVIHFPPLPPYSDSPGLHIALENALQDLRSFEEGGVDAVIIENNYDIPHQIAVDPLTITSMTSLGHAIRKATSLPIGICVLWNDYRASFAIAKAIGLQFIRIPVFVDNVQTDFGVVEGRPQEVNEYRSQIGAQGIAILADVHVKHATLLSSNTLEQSVQAAVENGADGVIITGKWTGDPPTQEDLDSARKTAGMAGMFAGSGVRTENIQSILADANGVIVSTSLKIPAPSNPGERNVLSWQQRIDVRRVKELRSRAHSSSY